MKINGTAVGGLSFIPAEAWRGLPDVIKPKLARRLENVTYDQNARLITARTLREWVSLQTASTDTQSDIQNGLNAAHNYKRITETLRPGRPGIYRELNGLRCMVASDNTLHNAFAYASYQHFISAGLLTRQDRTVYEIRKLTQSVVDPDVTLSACRSVYNLLLLLRTPFPDVVSTSAYSVLRDIETSLMFDDWPGPLKDVQGSSFTEAEGMFTSACSRLASLLEKGGREVYDLAEGIGDADVIASRNERKSAFAKHLYDILARHFIEGAATEREIVRLIDGATDSDAFEPFRRACQDIVAALDNSWPRIIEREAFSRIRRYREEFVMAANTSSADFNGIDARDLGFLASQLAPGQELEDELYEWLVIARDSNERFLPHAANVLAALVQRGAQRASVLLEVVDTALHVLGKHPREDRLDHRAMDLFKAAVEAMREGSVLVYTAADTLREETVERNQDEELFVKGYEFFIPKFTCGKRLRKQMQALKRIQRDENRYTQRSRRAAGDVLNTLRAMFK